MSAVGKHFPGHGFIKADTHLELAIDHRIYRDIAMEDLIPFKQLVDFGITGMMAAHVIYPNVDKHPAGFSSYWLKIFYAMNWDLRDVYLAMI